MPFYEYECPSCRYYLEVLQKISDPPLKKCPSCGKSGFKRLISAPVFRLKGSGWYETDFKSDKEGKRNLVGEDREESKPASSTETKADAKADTKADTKPEAAAPKEAKAEAAAPKTESAKSGDAKAAKPARGLRRSTTARAPARTPARRPARKGK